MSWLEKLLPPKISPTDPTEPSGALQTKPTIRFGNRQAQVNYAGMTAAGLC